METAWHWVSADDGRTWFPAYQGEPETAGNHEGWKNAVAWPPYNETLLVGPALALPTADGDKGKK